MLYLSYTKIMKIAVSTDHAGYEQIKHIQTFLESLGHECKNFGPGQYDESDDYPDFIKPAAEAVASGQCDMGIIFGGSGQGEAIVANRQKGIRCGVFYGPVAPVKEVDAEGSQSTDEYEILRLNRRHNNANMLSLGGRFLDQSTIEKAVSIWLETAYEEVERHARRIAKIDS